MRPLSGPKGVSERRVSDRQSSHKACCRTSATSSPRAGGHPGAVVPDLVNPQLDGGSRVFVRSLLLGIYIVGADEAMPYPGQKLRR
jgi:hypothetical protein